MAWGDLTSVNWVSFTNMQTSGIPLKSGQSHTTSNEWMTKAEVIAKYSVNEANSYLAAKSSNQWVAKRDLETGLIITFAVSGIYDGSYGVDIQLGVSLALPAATTVYFEWCTDSGADGYITFTLPAGFSGFTGALANLSMTGTFIGTYASGYVTTWSTAIVNQLNVKGGTAVVTTSDTTATYQGDWINVDNACGSATPVDDYCLLNC